MCRIWSAARLTRRRCVLAATFAVAAIAAAGCGGGSSPTGGGAAVGNAGFYTGGTPGGTPVHGGTAIVDSGEVPTTLDPGNGYGTPGEDRIYEALYDTLTEGMPGSNEPQPALASSWTVSPDGLTYTFAIRPGVRFSNGQPLTGADVVYSLQRLYKLAGAGVIYAKKLFRKISLAGPMTVQVRLIKPDPSLAGELSLPFFSIVPKRVLERESAQQFALHPVGTGPFMVKSATAGNSTVTTTRNPYYWRGAGQPYLDGIVFNAVENDNARILAVRSGSATIAVGVPYAQVAELQRTPGVRMLIQPLWGSGLNAINDTKAPLNEVNVRRALMYAIPYSAIIKTVYKGLATQSNSVVGMMKFWDPHVPTYTYDIAKAKALLKTTSVPHGFSLTIRCTGGETLGELTASILQSAWGRIGVHVDVHTSDYASLEADFTTGKYQVALFAPEGGVNEVWDPATAVFAYLSGVSSVVPSSHVAKLIESSSAASNESVRQKLFSEIQYDTYWKEPSWITIINLASFNLASDSLRGYQVLHSGHIRWERVWLAH